MIKLLNPQNQGPDHKAQMRKGYSILAMLILVSICEYVIDALYMDIMPPNALIGAYTAGVYLPILGLRTEQ